MKCNIAQGQRLPGNRRDHCLRHACAPFSPLHLVHVCKCRRKVLRIHFVTTERLPYVTTDVTGKGRGIRLRNELNEDSWCVIGILSSRHAIRNWDILTRDRNLLHYIMRLMREIFN